MSAKSLALVGSAGHQDRGMVQTWVTLGRVEPSAAWPESIALALLMAIDARPYIEKSVTLVNRI